MPDVRRGLIIVNTGPGKGKTTAAMGTALASAPPALPVRIAVAVVEQPLDHFTSTPQPPRASFESRGPPLS